MTSVAAYVNIRSLFPEKKRGCPKKKDTRTLPSHRE